MSTDLLSTLANQRPVKTADAESDSSWDMWLLASVFLLVGFGVVMLYSASAVMAADKFGDHLYLVKNQLQKIVLGVVVLFGALRLDYRWYQRLVYPILGGTFIMLILVLIPGIGAVQNGAQRWFSIGGMSFQPAEVAKIATVMFMAYSVSKKGDKMDKFSVAFVPHVAMVGLFVGLLMQQPDFGSSVILLTIMGILLFVSGAKIRYLSGFVVAGGVLAYFAITAREYRMERVQAYLDPFSYRTGIGYQISESLISIGSGGLTGVGLGNGTGKLGYVPELWNDFIGTIVAEELGLLGVVLLVGLFMTFLWRGTKIAFEANDEFGRYLAFGLTALIGMQAVANLCVVTGLLPNKGLTLPFVSFGGSSMIVALFSVGVLLNISKNQPDYWELNREEREARKAERRWKKKKRRILDRRDDLRNDLDL
ncbi:putative lipid II flippase FtsW [Persicimonas caeni]|uniref:Probable peptidoglycan glycosyltransferase FtsW n=1 Tax=Persicimonas caeni TaxID=2292766 RepID=A0A4Y6Q2I5_PERCE|nr:putative lipid II flippase FtsW [Persicimonas caeni]QDG54773.1 putative lipid II flippase FtsW [Persicimonas caeni]QED35994.1 putative lipid II flippase FtsW [Persicimonas caeni]